MSIVVRIETAEQTSDFMLLGWNNDDCDGRMSTAATRRGRLPATMDAMLTAGSFQLHAAGLTTERARVQERFPEAFAPVIDVAGLPRVLLIGDSISIGYTAPARELLAGVANVHRIFENGGATTRGLQQLDAWLGEGSWDVIHVNFGLHDIAWRDGEHPAVSPADYEANLRALITRLRATGTRPIFATTTPVPAMPGSPSRRNADVLAYNRIACRVMHEQEVPLNDLYTFILPHVDNLRQTNNVHFTPEGYRRLAGPVASLIRARLSTC